MKTFFSSLWSKDKKPLHWPESTRWPLQKHVKIVKTIPTRYILRNTDGNIEAVLSQKQYNKCVHPHKNNIERLPPVYILSDGTKVQGSFAKPFQHVQRKQVLQSLMRRWNIVSPLMFSSGRYRSALLSFSDKPFDKNFTYEKPSGKLPSDKPRTASLWFAIGLSWLDSDSIMSTGSDYRYLYQVILKDTVNMVSGKHLKTNESKGLQVLVLRDKKDVDGLRQAYINEMWTDVTGSAMYNWTDIGKRFGGIINYVPKQFVSWDVPSGCIWDKKCIKELVLIASIKP